MIEAEIIEEIKVPVLQDTKLPYKVSYVDELVEKYKTPIVLNAEDGETDDYKKAKEGAILLSKVMNAIEKERKILTDPALKYQKETKAKFDTEKNKLEPLRDLLKIERAKVDGYLEQQRVDAELKEEARVFKIREIIKAYEKLPMLCIGKSSREIENIKNLSETPTKELLEEHFDEALQIHYEAQTQLQSMIDEKILVENAKAIQDEANRQAQLVREEEDKKRALQQQEIDRKNAELEEKQRAFENQQRAIKEEQDRRDAEFESEKLRERQKAEKIEADRLALAESERLAKVEAERQESERLAKIEADKLAKKLQKEKEQKDLQLKAQHEHESFFDLDKLLNEDGVDIVTLVDMIIDNKVRHIKFEV